MSKTGYIYKLVSTDVEITECYVGSTNNERVRKSDHKKRCLNPNQEKYNLYVYQFIRDNGGWDSWDMIRLEEVKYNERQELHTRERYWLEQLNATLNKIIPTRTKKEYYEEHKTEIAEKNKEFYTNNRERILEQKKIYNIENKAKISEKNKRYRELNEQKIKEKRKEKITCECGKIITKNKYKRHQTSKTHKDYLETLNQ